MSPAKKRATKSARKTMKKATRKTTAKRATKAKKKATSSPAKSAAAKKTTRKAAKKSAKRDTAKSPAKKSAAVKPSQAARGGAAKPSQAARGGTAKPSQASRRGGTAKRPSRRAKKAAQGQGIARPLESAEKKPGLGAKWACFSCGAKFYDLNRPDPICPKCQTDQREQPLKSAEVPRRPPAKRPAAAPISRLLDEEEASEATLEEDADSDDAAELDIGKLNGEVGYLDDAEFNDDSDD